MIFSLFAPLKVSETGSLNKIKGSAKQIFRKINYQVRERGKQQYVTRFVSGDIEMGTVGKNGILNVKQ